MATTKTAANKAAAPAKKTGAKAVKFKIRSSPLERLWKGLLNSGNA